jgi:hypothetical protein
MSGLPPAVEGAVLGMAPRAPPCAAGWSCCVCCWALCRLAVSSWFGALLIWPLTELAGDQAARSAAAAASANVPAASGAIVPTPSAPASEAARNADNNIK